ncbi:helix-turn-helix transcriptional regulator [Selenomonas sp. WCA-380-WT-3B 3/]|uniref:Helix-turn-helix transcriptional regulator n=1 Tax=Selenomonas montiformis TaxID=2652285 RepID=A0A6I2UZX4_9FIRM|nr:helix-turn-helix transcriptional regulator [Selenomonas montiformis]MSV25915.1 helix-turn-helix transcriptional regulator [Selenomonas montiformis]
MNNLKKIRLALNISQEELAERLHVERSTIAKWENGTYPRASKLESIAKVLNCTVDDLLCAKK